MRKYCILALLAGISGAMIGCSDDSGSSDVKHEAQYELSIPAEVVESLQCETERTCTLNLNAEQAGLATVMLVQVMEDGTKVPVNGTVHVSSVGNAFTIQGGEASADISTGMSGRVVLMITAGAQSGTGAITFSTSDAIPTQSVMFVVNVKAPEEPVVDPVSPYEVDVDLTYAGASKLTFAEAGLIEGKTCAELIPGELTAAEIRRIQMGELKNYTSDIGELPDVASFKLRVSEKESETKTYAAVGRAMLNADYVVYGCTDGVTRSNNDIDIVLKDAKSSGVVIDPDDPITPIDPDRPEDPIVTDGVSYRGTYQLRSSFDALSLLPSASVDGSNVLFKDMLLGDWIRFSLDLLSRPEETIPAILTDQLLPLLLDADFFKDLLDKVAPSMSDILTPEVVSSLLEQFGVNRVIGDLIKEFTGQWEWLTTTTSVIDIVNELATNFTLEGQFAIKSATPDEDGKISGNTHSYSSILYSNGTFDKCIIGEDAKIRDVSNHVICRVNISTLDKENSGSVRGTFTSVYTEPSKENSQLMTMSAVESHSLDLAYGKLIYAALIQAIPYIIKPEDGAAAPSTIGGVVAYFIGMGLKELWNRDADHAENPITGSSCQAVGDFLSKFIQESVPAIDSIIATVGGSALLGSLCTMGVSSLDSLINSQLDKLSAGTDKVTFSSTGCAIKPNPEVTKIAYYGLPTEWGVSATNDHRCKWDVSIVTTDGEGNAKKQTIKGRYYAEGIGK